MQIVTHWQVPADHPALAGHFPGFPILPGVVLLDFVLQSIIDTHERPLTNCTVNTVKFLNPALAGDRLTVAYDQLEHDIFRFEISTSAHKIASGRLQFGTLS